MIAWLSSKVAILLFAVAMFASIMGIGLVVKNLSVLDASQRELYALASVVDSACSAPLNTVFETTVKFSTQKQVSVGVDNNIFFISLNGNKRGVHCALSLAMFTATRVKVRKANGVIGLGSY